VRLLAGTLIAWALVSLPVGLAARIWYIKADGTGDAPTIQAGVDSAAVGDTVLVGAGVYSDTASVLVDGEYKIVNVWIGKGLSLLSESSGGKPLIDGSASDIAIYVLNTEVEIAGFEIVTTLAGFGCVVPAATPTSWNVIFDDVGVRCDGGGVTVRDCVIHDHRWAVVFNHAVGCVEASEVYRSALGVVYLSGSSGEVADSRFHYCGVGVQAESSMVWVTRNQFAPGEFLMCAGVETGPFTQASIADNHFIDLFDIGVNCGGVVSATIERNRFERCYLSIQSITGRSVVVRQNLSIGHHWCINLFNVIDWVIEGNTIDSGVLALACQGALTQNVKVAKNIISRHETGLFCAFGGIVDPSCNDFFEVAVPFDGDCPGEMGIAGNFSRDPEYCGIDDSGNYFLQSDSPCAPGNHPDGYDCGLIGAFPVNCGKVEAKASSWGSIKSKFQGGSEFRR